MFSYRIDPRVTGVLKRYVIQTSLPCEHTEKLAPSSHLSIQIISLDTQVALMGLPQWLLYLLHCKIVFKLKHNWLVLKIKRTNPCCFTRWLLIRSRYILAVYTGIRYHLLTLMTQTSLCWCSGSCLFIPFASLPWCTA